MTKTTWSIIVFSVVLIGTSIWYWKFRAGEQEVILQTEKPRYGTVSNSITATGTVEPTDTVIVGTQVSGTIKRVYVDFNSVDPHSKRTVKIPDTNRGIKVEYQIASIKSNALDLN